jgi:hypothetical protein
LAPAFGTIATDRLLVRLRLAAGINRGGVATPFKNRGFLPSAGRAVFGTSSMRPMTHLVENEIADPLAAIAQEPATSAF